MTATSFRLNIGAFQCTVVSDGIISVPVPPPPSGNPQERTREIMDVTCLVIKNGQSTILVDTGCGNVFQATAGKLLENLRHLGISPADIDTIIYTHGHLDHVGGTLYSQSKLTFPKARQIVLRREWDFWASSTETTRNFGMYKWAVENLLPLRDQFDLAEDNAEVRPGIRLVPAVGHTLGSAMIEISSGKDKLVCVGDLIHSQVEFARPEHYAFLDAAPEEAIKLRTEGLSKIAESGALVFACHFPFPGIGRIVRNGNVLSWQPIQS